MLSKSKHKQVSLLDRSAPFKEEIVVTEEGVTKLFKGLLLSKERVTNSMSNYM